MTSKYCVFCQRQTIFEKPKVNHILHFFLSLVSMGMWVFLWVALIFCSAVSRSRCIQCGQTWQRLQYPESAPKPPARLDDAIGFQNPGENVEGRGRTRGMRR